MNSAISTVFQQHEVNTQNSSSNFHFNNNKGNFLLSSEKNPDLDLFVFLKVSIATHSQFGIRSQFIDGLHNDIVIFCIRQLSNSKLAMLIFLWRRFQNSAEHLHIWLSLKGYVSQLGIIIQKKKTVEKEILLHRNCSEIFWFGFQLLNHFVQLYVLPVQSIKEWRS